ncbi:hypothetical protein DD238_006316 [Peronospora effusa]|uniref:Uncharacterized protein n=1 Tax=Peronospora effusa TaxID=542832 RepID=A0A3M6V7S7_9STRA|nr:hypothetical protein DD238_006316 [Peronospora effusa]
MNDSDLQTDRYRIVIKNPIQFHMIVEFVGGEASIRMAFRFLHMTKKQTDLASLGSSSKGKVTSYIRYVCASNLQKFLKILVSCWTFSRAIHMSTSYMDIRIRLFVRSENLNIDFLAIPIHQLHWRQFFYACCVIFPNSRDHIVSRQKASPLASSKSKEPDFLCLCCDLHQLDIFLQRFFKRLSYKQYYSAITSLISCLRRQQNLINEMKTKAYKVAGTRW